MSRDLLGALAAMQAVATAAIDLRGTHATNPEWVGHARFHVVWQTANVVLLGGLAEWMLWSGALPEGVGFHLALALTVAPMLSFMAALATKGMFGATLRDRLGMPPLRVHAGGRRLAVDINTVAVAAGLVVSGVLLWWHDGFRAGQ